MTEWQRPIFFALIVALVVGVLFIELVVKRQVLSGRGLMKLSPDENRLQRFWSIGLLLCFALVFASSPRHSTGKPMFKWKRKYVVDPKTNKLVPATEAEAGRTMP